MKNTAFLTLCFGLASCGTPTSRTPETNEKVSISPQYRAAIRCWAVADTVKTLVDEGVTKKPALVEFARNGVPEWQAKSKVYGAEAGISTEQVARDFLDETLTILTPLKELPRESAVRYLQTLVRSGGACL